MSRPRLLDLFCGAGGAAMGYHRAGFEVVGVDLAPQPHYPFEFHRADALSYPLDGFDAIHASPPCQRFSRMAVLTAREYPDCLTPMRQRLPRRGPVVIENVEGAPGPWDLLLCGTMFGLRVRRHRLFQLGFQIPLVGIDCGCANGVASGRLVGHRDGGKVGPGRRRPPLHSKAERAEAMGIDWMTGDEMRQAIPPAYTEWIGRQLLQALAAVAR